LVDTANRSVVITGILQVLQAVVTFSVVPLLIKSLGTEQYGLWVTLISITTWIITFDFGIGYGFRNRVTDSLVKEDKKELYSEFVSTIQFYVLISLVILGIFLTLLFNLDILEDRPLLSVILFIPFILFFPANISVQILQGLRLVHVFAVINFLRACLWLSALLIYTTASDTISLVYLSLIYVVINTVYYSVLFLVSLRKSGLNGIRLKDLLTPLRVTSTLKVGGRFFLLQISSMIFFSMSNYFVFSFLSGESTTTFDTINKLYVFAFSFFSVLINVFWSEIAFYKSSSNFDQLRQIRRKLLIYTSIFSLASFAILPFVPFLIRLWTGGEIILLWSMLLPFSVMISIQAFAHSGAVFLNAFEKIRPQIILSIIGLVLYYTHIKF
jgi:O-antigen/teichoic acid export membrane protein